MNSLAGRIAAAAIAGLFASGTLGCELIAGVDRDKIPAGAGGATSTATATGAGGTGGATSTATGAGGAGGATSTGVGGSTSTGTGGSTSTATASSTGAGGAGGATSSSSGSSGTGGMGCTLPADCPGMDNACQTRTCAAGICGFDFVPAGDAPAAAQTTGDCHKKSCDGQGTVNDANDDADLPVDNNPCTLDVCNGGIPGNPLASPGASCGGTQVCNALGQCVGCTVAATCPGMDDECQTRSCSAAGTCGFSFAPMGTAVASQQAGDCHKNVCNGAGAVVNVVDNNDPTVDGNQCTNDVCTNGVPSNPSASVGAACAQNMGTLCNGSGVCVQCIVASTCPGQNTACQTKTCVTGQCGFSFTAAGTPAGSQLAGDCHLSQCNGLGAIVNGVDDSDVPVDNNPCTSDVCTSGAPTNPPAPSGGGCSQNGGKVCNGGGACVQCLTPSDCSGNDTACQARTCINSTCGLSFQPSGTVTPSQTPGDCQKTQCNGAGGIVSVADDSDVPADGNACTSDVCTSGAPSNPPLVAGTSCNQSGGDFCDGSGSCVATVLILAGGTSGMLGGELHPGGAWSTTALAGVTVDGVSLAVTSAARGVGLMRFTLSGDPGDNLVEYTTWTGGAWSPFAAIGAGITTRGRPSVSSASSVAQAAFQGQDFKYYYAAIGAGAWSPVAEVVGSPQSFGPVPGDLAAIGSDAAFAFLNGGSNNDLFGQDRTAGAWGSAQSIAGSTSASTSPSLVALTSGPELLSVYVQSDAQVMFATRTAGVWSAAAAVGGATTNDPVSIAALPGGAAILAFRGTDAHLYTASFAAGAWSAPAAIASPNVTITAPPAIAHGVGSAAAELGFIETDAVAYHARLIGGAWSTPVAVGGTNLGHVAIASAP